eukprot:2841329-Amphidinium_carterae.1
MPEVAPSAESPLGVQSLVHCRSEMAAPAVSAAGENAFGPSVAVGVPHQDVLGLHSNMMRLVLGFQEYSTTCCGMLCNGNDWNKSN